MNWEYPHMMVQEKLEILMTLWMNYQKPLQVCLMKKQTQQRIKCLPHTV